MSELKNDSERIELRYCRACETEVDSVDGECTKCGQPTERRNNMSEANNFVYLVMQHDISMGKEWVMYAYDNYTDAEDTVKHHNKEDGSSYPRYFVKSVRYFKKGGV